MVITPGEQGCARGRTHCSGVKTVVLKSVFRESIKAWSRHRTAKSAGSGKANIISHHEQYVGRACRCFHVLRDKSDE